MYSYYECPRCHQRVRFQRQDFEKHTQQTFTNLSVDDASRINRALERDPIAAESFLDFYCPGCALGVRIYYCFWAGGRHGDCGFKLEKVIEVLD